MRTFVTLKKADVRLAMRLLNDLSLEDQSVIDSHSPANGDAFDESVVAEARKRMSDTDALVKRLEEALEAKR